MDTRSTTIRIAKRHMCSTGLAGRLRWISLETIEEEDLGDDYGGFSWVANVNELLSTGSRS